MNPSIRAGRVMGAGIGFVGANFRPPGFGRIGV
jgi:hypothetical protein